MLQEKNDLRLTSQKKNNHLEAKTNDEYVISVKSMGKLNELK